MGLAVVGGGVCVGGVCVGSVISRKKLREKSRWRTRGFTFGGNGIQEMRWKLTVQAVHSEPRVST